MPRFGPIKPKQMAGDDGLEEERHWEEGQRKRRGQSVPGDGDAGQSGQGNGATGPVEAR